MAEGPAFPAIMYKSYKTKIQGPRALHDPSLTSSLGWGMMHSAVGILLLLHIEFLRGLKQTLTPATITPG